MTHQEFSCQLKLEMDVHLNSDLFHRYSMFVDNNPTLFDSAPEIHNIYQHSINFFRYKHDQMDKVVLVFQAIIDIYIFCIANSCA